MARSTGKPGRKRTGSAFMVERVFPAHEDRAFVLSELHARPFHPVAAPREVFHFALMTSEAQAGRHREALESLLKLRGLAPLPEGARHHRAIVAGVEIRWEAHTEFTTWGFSVADDEGDPFSAAPPAQVRELLEGLPGELIVAVRVAVRAGRRKAGPAGLGDFDPQSMCVSQTNSGGARVATDIKPDTAGFVRFLVEAGDLPPGVSGALVQRLLEIETYRCVALLGLPLAHKVSSKVRTIEQSLAAVTAKMQAARGLEDNRALLETLAALATEVEALSAETSYRFSASRAYSQIVAGRLEALEETAYDQAPAIGSFLSRRMAPAMRTCESIERRIEDLSDKLSRAATLLRARVDVELESQNRNLLATMNRRARQQLRLQHTVEGLSVAAVSYYVVGLVSYVIKGAKGTGMDLPTQTLTAMAVPVVVALVWLTVRRIRAAHGDEEEG